MFFLPFHEHPPKINRTIENQLFEDISPIIEMVMLQLAMLLFVGYMILERSNSGANFVGSRILIPLREKCAS